MFAFLIARVEKNRLYFRLINRKARRRLRALQQPQRLEARGAAAADHEWS